MPDIFVTCDVSQVLRSWLKVELAENIIEVSVTDAGNAAGTLTRFRVPHNAEFIDVVPRPPKDSTDVRQPLPCQPPN